MNFEMRRLYKLLLSRILPLKGSWYNATDIARINVVRAANGKRRVRAEDAFVRCIAAPLQQETRFNARMNKIFNTASRICKSAREDIIHR